jgi:hypothetical protein
MTGLDAVDDRFPIFEIGYGDSEGPDATYVRSRNGILLARAANGGSFRWISLRLISSAVSLRVSYTCRYSPPGDDGVLTADAPAGERCPPEDADAITQLAFRSKIYYRCWVARTGRPGEQTADPASSFWYPSGQLCGTTEPGAWITALEIKMPPIFEAWRTASHLISR